MKLTDVYFSYKNCIVLEEINLEFSKDCIYGIIGHNGAGKTTLLRLCLGLLTPQKGIIEDDFSEKSYMPEKGGLYDYLTVKQNLYVDFRDN